MPTEPAPDVLALIDAIKAHFPDIGGTVTEAAEARRILAAAPAWPFEPPAVGSVEDRAIPGPEGAPDIPVRVYLPSPAPATGAGPVSPRPTVVFFHGGGWVIGGLDTHDPVARPVPGRRCGRRVGRLPARPGGTLSRGRRRRVRRAVLGRRTRR
ncbi:alpha/beta hydrolase [Streptomyces sp. NBC_00647]|uniref:hypothetical protein n=1 Tax=Streptomyces sp. NBC_00647 TaxID=2975796 RepID=UPI00324A0BEA